LADDFDLYVINSPKTEDRTFAYNAAKEEKEPNATDAAVCMNDRFGLFGHCI
jgi:hypothetical protein